MEERIENYIDSGLENIAPQLYIFSIAAGILLVLIGFIMAMNNRATSTTKKIGVTSICIGILAFFSGTMQYLL